MRALIIEHGYSRGALAAVRALSSAGWSVGVGAPERGGLAALSRFARRWHRVPSPQESVDAFVSEVQRAVKKEGYEVVFGAGDAELIALSQARNDIGTNVPYPRHEAVVQAVAKRTLAENAESVGLSTPETYVATVEGLERSRGPLIVKTNVHWHRPLHSSAPRIEAAISKDVAGALEHAGRIEDAGGEPLIQELISGRLMAFSTVVDRAGTVLARVQQVAERVWPSGAGISARAITMPVDESLARRIAGLLRRLGWVGLAQLQFIIDEQGEPRLIDLNGRFYGSLALAKAAGPNLPHLWACLATGRDAPRAADPRPGIRYQWLEGDLRRALAERRGGIWKDVLDTLRYAAGANHSVWRAEDPWPAVRYSGHLALRALRKMGRKALE